MIYEVEEYLRRNKKQVSLISGLTIIIAVICMYLLIPKNITVVYAANEVDVTKRGFVNDQLLKNTIEDYYHQEIGEIESDEVIKIDTEYSKLKLSDNIVNVEILKGIDFEGNKKEVYAATTGELLEELNIELDENEYLVVNGEVDQDLIYEINNNDLIEIVELIKETKEYYEPITSSYEKEKIYSSEVKNPEVIVEKQDGSIKHVYNYYYKDGELVQEELIEEVVISYPQNGLMQYYTVEANTSAFSTYGTSTLTASGITVDGNARYYDPEYGDVCVVAAPEQYPFGTIIEFEYNGTCIVLERGSSIEGNKFDILYPTYDQALNHGRIYQDASVLRVGW